MDEIDGSGALPSRFAIKIFAERPFPSTVLPKSTVQTYPWPWLSNSII
jgi:hypothetical protein